MISDKTLWNFITAAEHEDSKLGLGQRLLLGTVAKRASMTDAEARVCLDEMVKRGLARTGSHNEVQIEYEEIRFARKQQRTN